MQTSRMLKINIYVYAYDGYLAADISFLLSLSLFLTCDTKEVAGHREQCKGLRVMNNYTYNIKIKLNVCMIAIAIHI